MYPKRCPKPGAWLRLILMWNSPKKFSKHGTCFQSMEFDWRPKMWSKLGAWYSKRCSKYGTWFSIKYIIKVLSLIEIQRCSNLGARLSFTELFKVWKLWANVIFKSWTLIEMFKLWILIRIQSDAYRMEINWISKKFSNHEWNLKRCTKMRSRIKMYSIMEYCTPCQQKSI